MFKVKKERINLKKKLGSGNFGTVFPYQRDPDDLKWVVKRIHADDTDKLLSYIPEIVLGFSCDHPCIVPVKGYSIEKAEQEDYYIYIKLPRMKQSLKEKFDEKKRSQTSFSEEEIVRCFYSLACAIEYLHTKKIFHRDIKLDNILLDSDENAKLSDIGVAKHVAEEELYHALSGQTGAVDYTAPEILQMKSKLPKESLKAGDYWSLGLVMLELCALKFRLINPYGSKESIEKSLGGVREKLQETYSENLLSVIFGLLEFDPKERMNTEEVKRRLEGSYKLLFLQKTIKKLGSEKHSEEEGSEALLNEKLQKYEKGINKLKEEIKKLKQQNDELQKEWKFHQSIFQQFNSELIRKWDVYQSSLLKPTLKTLSNTSQKSPEIKIEIIPGSSLKDDQEVLKAVFLGPSYVGKSTVIQRCLLQEFNEDFNPTFFERYTFRAFADKSTAFHIHLDDTNGGEEYEVMHEAWIRNSTAVVLVYDVVSEESFQKVKKLLRRARGILGEEVIVYLVGNKSDLAERRAIPLGIIQEFVKENKIVAHFEMSSKTGENSEDFIQHLARTLIKKAQELYSKPQKPKKFFGLF